MWTTWKLKAQVNGTFNVTWNAGHWQFDARKALSEKAALKSRIRAWCQQEADRLLSDLVSKNEAIRGMSIAATDRQRWEGYTEAYEQMLIGNPAAARAIWSELEDWARLRFTLHAWDLFKCGSVSPDVWGVLLRSAWQRGNIRALLMYANVTPNVLQQMFASASLSYLMENERELARFEALPDFVSVWRGTRTTSPHRKTGLSWTLSRQWAQRFAHVNTYNIGRPALLYGVVARSSILAYFADEEEVVINPKHRVTMLAQMILPRDERGTRIDAIRDGIRAEPA